MDTTGCDPGWASDAVFQPRGATPTCDTPMAGFWATAAVVCVLRFVAVGVQLNTWVRVHRARWAKARGVHHWQWDRRHANPQGKGGETASPPSVAATAGGGGSTNVWGGASVTGTAPTATGTATVVSTAPTTTPSGVSPRGMRRFPLLPFFALVSAISYVLIYVLVGTNTASFANGGSFAVWACGLLPYAIVQTIGLRHTVHLGRRLIPARARVGGGGAGGDDDDALRKFDVVGRLLFGGMLASEATTLILLLIVIPAVAASSPPTQSQLVALAQAAFVLAGVFTMCIVLVFVHQVERCHAVVDKHIRNMKNVSTSPSQPRPLSTSNKRSNVAASQSVGASGAPQGPDMTGLIVARRRLRMSQLWAAASLPAQLFFFALAARAFPWTWHAILLVYTLGETIVSSFHVYLIYGGGVCNRGRGNSSKAGGGGGSSKPRSGGSAASPRAGAGAGSGVLVVHGGGVPSSVESSGLGSPTPQRPTSLLRSAAANHGGSRRAIPSHQAPPVEQAVALGQAADNPTFDGHSAVSHQDHPAPPASSS